MSPLAIPALLTALILATPVAAGLDISVVGVFPGKAVLVVDGANPKAYSVGDLIAPGIRLTAATQDTATVDAQGRRQVIPLGGHINRNTPSGPSKVVLQADGRGHFIANGQINGATIALLVDTGATLVALPAADARRLGIDFKKGQPGTISTANGPVAAWRVRLDRLRIGDIELNQVDATVHEAGLPIALLGMSFLNRTEMRQEGEKMTLTKRY